jgi:transcriptional regulator with XRE-family HTH domain
MAFPDNLRRTRLARFFSQAELARRSGVHAITITRLESGRTAPSTRTVRALAAALDVEPGQLATPAEVAEADKWQRRSNDRRAGGTAGKGGRHVQEGRQQDQSRAQAHDGQ